MPSRSRPLFTAGAHRRTQFFIFSLAYRDHGTEIRRTGAIDAVWGALQRTLTHRRVDSNENPTEALLVAVHNHASEHELHDVATVDPLVDIMHGSSSARHRLFLPIKSQLCSTVADSSKLRLAV